MFVWLVHQGLLARFVHPGALYGIVNLDKYYTLKQQAPSRSVASESPTTLIHRLRDAVCLMAETYDAEYVRQIEWLPKWATRHGKLNVLKRLAVVFPHEEVFTRKRFDSLLYNPGGQDVVRWFLEQVPALLATRVVQGAVLHGKRSLLQWLF